MIYALYGALGAALVLLFFAAGVFAGYKLKARMTASEAARAPKPETPEEAERRRFIADQKAAHMLYNYNVDMAYGLVTAKDFETKDGDI